MKKHVLIYLCLGNNLRYANMSNPLFFLTLFDHAINADRKTLCSFYLIQKLRD